MDILVFRNRVDDGYRQSETLVAVLGDERVRGVGLPVLVDVLGVVGVRRGDRTPVAQPVELLFAVGGVCQPEERPGVGVRPVVRLPAVHRVVFHLTPVGGVRVLEHRDRSQLVCPDSEILVPQLRVHVGRTPLLTTAGVGLLGHVVCPAEYRRYLVRRVLDELLTVVEHPVGNVVDDIEQDRFQHRVRDVLERVELVDDVTRQSPLEVPEQVLDEPLGELVEHRVRNRVENLLDGVVGLVVLGRGRSHRR